MILLVGEYVSQYAEDFLKQYGEQSGYPNAYDASRPYAGFEGGSPGNGTFIACCTTGIQYVYNEALGIDLFQYGFNASCTASINLMTSSSYKQNWERIMSNDALQPGDILLSSNGHTELYIGNNKTANWGETPFHINYDAPFLGGRFDYAFRLSSSVQVDPSGKVTGAGFRNGKSMNYSDFFFNGIPDGKYSLATKASVFQKIIDKIVQLFKYLSNLIIYLFRGFLIGIISIFDRLVNNTVKSVEDAPLSIEEAGVGLTNADDPSKMNRSVTIEGLVFNDLDLFDVNIFKTNNH